MSQSFGRVFCPTYGHLVIDQSPSAKLSWSNQTTGRKNQKNCFQDRIIESWDLVIPSWFEGELWIFRWHASPSTRGCLSLVSWAQLGELSVPIIPISLKAFIQSASSAWWEETHAPVEDFDVNAKRTDVEVKMQESYHGSFQNVQCTIQKPARGTYSRRNTIVTLHSNAIVKLEILTVKR